MIRISWDVSFNSTGWALMRLGATISHDHPAITSALDQRRKATAQLVLDNPDPRIPPTK
jgi:hypothetical protein